MGVHLRVLRAPLAQLHARRWRNHNGGRFGPKFTKFPTEVKMNFPPKERSKLWLLPDSKKIMFVANGWYYPKGKKSIEENRVMTPVLAFVRPHSQVSHDNLTAAEFAVFEKMFPMIEAQFKECEKTLDAEIEADAQSKHVCR